MKHHYSAAATAGVSRCEIPVESIKSEVVFQCGGGEVHELIPLANLLTFVSYVTYFDLM